MAPEERCIRQRMHACQHRCLQRDFGALENSRNLSIQHSPLRSGGVWPMRKSQSKAVVLGATSGITQPLLRTLPTIKPGPVVPAMTADLSKLHISGQAVKWGPMLIVRCGNRRPMNSSGGHSTRVSPRSKVHLARFSLHASIRVNTSYELQRAAK